jgi:hypothetical protein
MTLLSGIVLLNDEEKKIHEKSVVSPVPPGICGQFFDGEGSAWRYIPQEATALGFMFWFWFVKS